MIIKFLGTGGAFASKKLYQSNMVIESKDKSKTDLFLIDCGTDIRFSLQECYPHINNGNVGDYIKNVYISHLHGDHIGGLEWLGYTTYFNDKSPKPRLITSSGLTSSLWNNCLKGTMATVVGKLNKLDDYFEVNSKKTFYLNEGEDDELKLSFVPGVHVRSKDNIKISFGLFIESKNKKTYLTTDVNSTNYKLNKEFYEKADQIFHDCETTPYKSGVHYHYEDLKKLPLDIKNKMYLYHYSEDAHEKYNPVKDGFKGFVKRKKSYTL